MSKLRVFFVTALAHLVVLCFVWIGFPVSTAIKEKTDFVYIGTGGLAEVARQVSSADFASKNINVFLPEGGTFMPWIIHRSVSRPTH